MYCIPCSEGDNNVISSAYDNAGWGGDGRRRVRVGVEIGKMVAANLLVVFYTIPPMPIVPVKNCEISFFKGSPRPTPVISLCIISSRSL